MCKLFIVTYIDFWRSGAGHRARLSSLINYFKTKAEITVVYAGILDEQDERTLGILYPEIKIDALEKNGSLTYKEFAARFEDYIQGKSVDILIVEYIELSFVLRFLESHVITLLDTHDLISDRIKSLRDQNVPYNGIDLTEEEELQIFKCFDYIITIQEKDFLKLRAQMDDERVLLVPHPVNFRQKLLRKWVVKVGFVASEYAPNVDGLLWFLSHVWPSLHTKHQLTLEVYGGVHKALPGDLTARFPGVNLHGFTHDLNVVYENCDVMINPVRCGAGLKIKNVEALGNGLPLLTTSHGSLGIESGSNQAFLMADTLEDFESCMERLVIDYDYRIRLGNNAYEYAQRNFSIEKCYQPLEVVMLTERKFE